MTPWIWKLCKIETLVKSLLVAKIEQIKHCFTVDKLDPSQRECKAKENVILRWLNSDQDANYNRDDSDLIESLNEESANYDRS